MNYIINPAVFYFLHMVNGLRLAVGVALCLSITVSIVWFIMWVTTVDCSGMDDEDAKMKFKMIKKSLVFVAVFTIALIVIPSKNTLIEIQIAKYATYDNANWTLETIKSAADYIVEAIKSLK